MAKAYGKVFVTNLKDVQKKKEEYAAAAEDIEGPSRSRYFVTWMSALNLRDSR